MTKEELKEEANDIVYGMGYDTYEGDGHSDFAVEDILVKFAEPREKRITELEKENAGLKAGKTKWHNLRKDQNDLPDNSRYVWTNVGPGYHDDDGWWDDFGRLQNVVAWCEPKFEE